MNKNQKALGGVVATALLIVMAVVTVVSYQTWLNNYNSQIFTKNEKQNLNSIELNHLQGNELYVNNKNNEEIEYQNILVDGEECNINGNISERNISKINLGFCTLGMTVGYKEVSIVTNKGIITKYLNLKSIEKNNLTISYQNSKTCSSGTKLFGLYLDKTYTTHVETSTNNQYNYSLCVNHPLINFNLNCNTGKRIFYLGSITGSHIWFDNSSAYPMDPGYYNWQEICLDSDYGNIDLKFGGSWTSQGYLPLIEYYQDDLLGGMTGLGFSHPQKQTIWLKITNS